MALVLRGGCPCGRYFRQYCITLCSFTEGLGVVVSPQPRTLFALLFSHPRLADGGRCHPSTILEPLTHTGWKGNRRHNVRFEELEEKEIL